MKIPKLRFKQLEILKSVKEITDFLVVDMNSPRVHNLSFLSNLRSIHGRRLDASAQYDHFFNVLFLIDSSFREYVSIDVMHT
jgi:Receptor L domain